MKLNIKPLSVNQVWQGKRYKTPAYRKYERDVMMILPSMEIPEGDLAVCIHYGFSSPHADIDNPTKPFVDILQKKYGFNDRRITRMSLTKEQVSKGQEFIQFSITEAG